MLSEQSESQNTTCCAILFIEHSQNDEILKMENRLVVSRARGLRGEGQEVGVTLKVPCECCLFGDVAVPANCFYRLARASQCHRTTCVHCTNVRFSVLKLNYQ